MVCDVSCVPHLHAIRIVRIWHKLKIAEVKCTQRRGDKSVHYYVAVCPSISKLPSLLYTYDRSDLNDLTALAQAIERQEPEKNPRQPKYGVSKDKREQLLKEM